jgi:hypothetical protein
MGTDSVRAEWRAIFPDPEDRVYRSPNQYQRLRARRTRFPHYERSWLIPAATAEVITSRRMHAYEEQHPEIQPASDAFKQAVYNQWVAELIDDGYLDGAVPE